MTTKIEQTPDPAILDLLNAPTGSLRVDDVYALQGYARALDAEVKRAAAEAQRQIDQRIADSHDAARMREIDALVSGGRLLDRERLQLRWQTMAESGDMRNVTDYGVELVTAFAAALLTDGAVRAAAQESYRERHAVSAGNFPRSIMAAAIRAAGVEPVERAGSVVTVPVAMYDAEKARADKAHEVLEAERAESRINRENAAREAYQEAAKAQDRINQLSIDAADSRERLAALETVIAETSHAAGISGTMTPAARVRAMGSALGTAKRLADDYYAGLGDTAQARDIAKAEADALRAEVAALRGLDRSHTAVCCIVDSVKGQLGQTTYVGAQTGLREALATVPPAKVADAVRPEAAGLEPIDPIPGAKLSPWGKAMQDRVNELSAIAKRGGL